MLQRIAYIFVRRGGPARSNPAASFSTGRLFDSGFDE
jgi:hypothetical protein